ncbi:MAG: FAD binding domain-containing protein [Gammaproteobacteria bacterium]|nr:FAD binding domain-containing protein [Gammaproteobacteria bacterium]
MEYYNPTEISEAYSLLSRYGEAAVPIAGSTFFMGHREELFDEVEAVINIKRLGLSYIRLESGMLKIGATTTLDEIFSAKETSRGAFRVFSETVSELNIKEVRNVATIGGEVCIAGEVDMPTTLLAYDASIVIGSSKGTRVVSMEDFHIGYLRNALKPGEMVTEVRVPVPPPRTGGGFHKFERTAADLPLVNVAARLTLGRKGECEQVRIAVGAATAAGVPVRAQAAEKLLNGRKPDDALILEAAQAAGTVECVNDFRASAELRSLWVSCGAEDALKKAIGQAREER